jgi:autotransporter-associated beta strand protein
VGGRSTLAGTSNYTGSRVAINSGILALLNGSTTQKPLGTANVVVNPGGILRLAANNVGPIAVNSDMGALGVLGLAYNPGAAALPNAAFNANGGPFTGTVGIDVVGFSKPLDMAAIGGGSAFLGSTQGGYYTGTTLGVGSGNTYRLGTGSRDLYLNTSVLTGSASVQIGAVSNTVPAQSIALSNNGGTVFLNTPNNYTGGTTLVQGANVYVNNPGALGSGTINFAGGGLFLDAFGMGQLLGPRVFNNPLALLGDAVFTTAGNNNNSDLILTAPLALSNTQTASGPGTVRTITTSSTASLVVLSGGVTDGPYGGNTLVKAGPGALALTGNNTFTGVLQINQARCWSTTTRRFPPEHR